MYSLDDGCSETEFRAFKLLLVDSRHDMSVNQEIYDN